MTHYFSLTIKNIPRLSRIKLIPDFPDQWEPSNNISIMLSASLSRNYKSIVNVKTSLDTMRQRMKVFLFARQRHIV